MLTLFSLVLVTIFVWNDLVPPVPFVGMTLTSLFLMLLSLGSFFYQHQRLLQVSHWVSPEAFRILQKDKQLQGISIVWLILALLLVGATTFSPSVAFVMWIIMTAFSLDLWLYYKKRMTFLSIPESLLKTIFQEGERGAKCGSLEEVKDKIGVLSDMADRALRRSLLTFAIKAVETMKSLLVIYMDAVGKEKLLHAGEEEWLQANEKQVSYLLCLFSERIEGLFKRSLASQAEPLLTQLMAAAGGAAVGAAHVDMNVVSIPVYSLERMEEAAADAHRSDLGLKFSLTLVGVARELSFFPHIELLDIEGAYLPLVLQLERISKDLFKRDKKTPISSLTKPFYDMREIVEKPPLDTHPNAMRIVAEINRILAEFQELERILMTIPGIPGYDTPHAEHSS